MSLGAMSRASDGNPSAITGRPIRGGRPKVLGDVQELARQQSPEAINTLVGIMQEREGSACGPSSGRQLAA
jgi:hypothetical protein